MNYSANQCEEIVRATKAKRYGEGFLGHCPAHDDKNPSFSIKTDKDVTLVKCFAGCEFNEIKKSLENENIRYPLEKKTKREINLIKYPYYAESGLFAFNVIRKDYYDGTKTISRDRKGYKENLRPYKYEMWRERIDETIFIAEGEKCVHALLGQDLLATTTQGGSGAWRSSYAKYFKGHDVVILPDNDDTGLMYSLNAYKDVKLVAKSVKIVELPELTNGQDVYDWFIAGNTKEDLLKLVETVSSDIPPVNIIDNHAKKTDLTFDQNTSNTLENVTNAVESITGLDVWFDEFHQKRFYREAGGETKEWTDNDSLRFTFLLQSRFNFKKCRDDMVEKAVQHIATKNIRNELSDWADSLVWDGTSRVDTFLIDCFGAEDNEYTHKASKNFLLQLMARTFLPGCQADYMLILEGPQGFGKSTALQVLGEKYYAEITDSPGSKDFALALMGKLICEISELSSFSKADLNHVKSAVSRRVDHLRLPYGRTAQDFPRRCVLVGTTNENEYLRDSTGARRFWPIKVGNINTQKIKVERDQLFAEARMRFKKGEHYWEMPETTKEEQELRRQEDPWESVLAQWLTNASDCFDTAARPIVSTTIGDILNTCFRIENSKQLKSDQMRVANILKSWGWEKYLNGHDRIKTWRKK